MACQLRLRTNTVALLKMSLRRAGRLSLFPRQVCRLPHSAAKGLSRHTRDWKSRVPFASGEDRTRCASRSKVLTEEKSVFHNPSMSTGPSEITHVSDTALLVAGCRAIESERPDALVRDPFAARLASERGKAMFHAVPHPEIMGFGMAIRTRFLDELVLNAGQRLFGGRADSGFIYRNGWVTAARRSYITDLDFAKERIGRMMAGAPQPPTLPAFAQDDPTGVHRFDRA